jgi:hypothetical protein
VVILPRALACINATLQEIEIHAEPAGCDRQDPAMSEGPTNAGGAIVTAIGHSPAKPVIEHAAWQATFTFGPRQRSGDSLLFPFP